jgi:hypothetical protein
VVEWLRDNHVDDTDATFLVGGSQITYDYIVCSCVEAVTWIDGIIEHGKPGGMKFREPSRGRFGSGIEFLTDIVGSPRFLWIPK